MIKFLRYFRNPAEREQAEKGPPQLTPEQLAEFESLKKSCIAIKATPVDMNDIAIGESRFGGLPDVPEGFTWPSYKGTAFPFIAQINFREFSPLDQESLLPRNGHLLVFYEGGTECWGFRPDDDKYWKLLYVPDGTRLNRQTPPVNLPEWPTIRPGKLTLTTAISYADPWDFAAIDLTKEERDIYIEYFDSLKLPNGGHQLLGHSRNIQNDMKLECQLTSNGIDCGGSEGYQDPRRKELEPGAADWTLLLQFDTDDDLGVMWGDVGTIYVWIRKQDLAAENFDKARICFQCG